MNHYPQNRQFDICIRCQTVSKFNNEEKVFKCPHCDFSIKYAELESLLKVSFNSVYFGYQYREIYESVYENDEDIYIRFALEPVNELYYLIATSVISGIVGNLAYDFIKKIARNILKKEIQVYIKDEELVELLDDDEEFRKFYFYIFDYLNGLKNVKPKVKEAIEDEIRVDKSMESMDKKEENRP
ncbi:hypothetical protein [Paludibacter sp.]|uniref:hypothetical protein n=1 Tax=Paludibacter sp. TaxID=1898105 RepID=UPI0013539577|nr:hypothetical protein [Paludibacter sp.]MTK54477.1 hypothetical protein [Paludibacter sp.]